MKITVCVKQSSSGEINPLDACAYEAALNIPNAEITLVSMGPQKSEAMLSELSRLGAERAILISDPLFAGSDTLATAYILSLAIKKLDSDLILCGSKTVDGETGQVGVELATLLGFPVIPRVMRFENENGSLFCQTRSSERVELDTPALATVERIGVLRFPSIFSKAKGIETWSADDLGADPTRCGLHGSPTRVLKTEENHQDRRKCTFITPKELKSVIADCLSAKNETTDIQTDGVKIKGVWAVGEAAAKMAKGVSDGLRVIETSDAKTIAKMIENEKPTAVLWDSSEAGKLASARVAAMLGLGLCADCTRLETDGQELFFYRPAFSGNVIAKIKCIGTPAMATLRTPSDTRSEIIVGFGMGVKGKLEEAKKLAEALGAETAASRALVDSGEMPYEAQVGVTGKSVSPKVYIALGISGAIHHISGIRTADKIIAINPDKYASVFDFADYGVVADLDGILNEFNS